MTSFARTTEIFAAEKWDAVAFKNCFHEEFMFVRETDLVARDESCAYIDELMEQGKLDWEKIELIHENDHVIMCCRLQISAWGCDSLHFFGLSPC